MGFWVHFNDDGSYDYSGGGGGGGNNFGCGCGLVIGVIILYNVAKYLFEEWNVPFEAAVIVGVVLAIIAGVWIYNNS